MVLNAEHVDVAHPRDGDRITYAFTPDRQVELVYDSSRKKAGKGGSTGWLMTAESLAPLNVDRTLYVSLDLSLLECKFCAERLPKTSFGWDKSKYPDRDHRRKDCKACNKVYLVYLPTASKTAEYEERKERLIALAQDHFPGADFRPLYWSYQVVFVSTEGSAVYYGHTDNPYRRKDEHIRCQVNDTRDWMRRSNAWAQQMKAIKQNPYQIQMDLSKEVTCQFSFYGWQNMYDAQMSERGMYRIAKPVEDEPGRHKVLNDKEPKVFFEKDAGVA